MQNRCTRPLAKLDSDSKIPKDLQVQDCNVHKTPSAKLDQQLEAEVDLYKMSIELKLNIVLFVLWIILTILSLIGCVDIGQFGKLKTPRSDLVATNASDAQESAYPNENWWEAYNDTQLDKLINKALSQSPTIKEASARILQADALFRQATNLRIPIIDAKLSVQKYRQSYNNGVPKAFVPKGFQNTGSMSINFAYELDIWGRNKAIIASNFSALEAAKLEATQTKILLSTQVASLYASLVGSYAELDEAKNIVEVRMKTVKLFQERHDKQLENEGSVAVAKANHAFAESEVQALEGSIALIRNSLSELVGDLPSDAMEISRPNIVSVKSCDTPSDIPINLISHRLDIIAAKLRLEAAAHLINVAKTGFYPNINLMAYIGHQSLGLSSLLKSSSLIGAAGPAINLPIFEKARLEGIYLGARADYDLKLAEYEKTIIHAVREVSDVIISQKSLVLRRKKLETALSEAKHAYAVANNRYRGGLATYLEVLRAEDTLIKNRSALVDIKAQKLILDIALVRALGGGFTPLK